MRILPNSIFGRTVLVLLAGLIVSHLISLAIYSGTRDEELSTISGRQMSERIVAAYETLEHTPPDRRIEVARTLWGPGFSFTWTQRSILPPVNDKSWRLRALRKSLVHYLDNVDEDGVRVSFRQVQQTMPETIPEHWRSRRGHDGDEHWESDVDPMFAMRHHMGRENEISRFGRMSRLWHGGRVLVASLRLSDDSWLNVAAPAERFRPFWWSQGMLSITLMMFVVIIFSIWAVHRSAGPLGLFAKAAERLGRDVNAPPLAEDGPREVRRASIAFNDMQRKLRSFIHDRTQMLAAISHDLRTPITRMRLRAELIADEEQKHKMMADLVQMEEMIAATLSFARDEAADEPTARFDLAAMLQSLVDDAVDGGKDAICSGPEKLIFRGRSTALKRAFQNLIDNACQYGGRAEVSFVQDDSVVRIMVTDDGPGIQKSEQEQVFAPFYRIENSRSRETGGVGLGLAVARTAIRAHGGEIFMDFPEHGGFRITAKLPFIAESSDPEMSEKPTGLRSFFRKLCRRC